MEGLSLGQAWLPVGKSFSNFLAKVSQVTAALINETLEVRSNVASARRRHRIALRRNSLLSIRYHPGNSGLRRGN